MHVLDSMWTVVQCIYILYYIVLYQYDDSIHLFTLSKKWISRKIVVSSV